MSPEEMIAIDPDGDPNFYFTDRTRIQKHQQCPRARYYHSEIESGAVTVTSAEEGGEEVSRVVQLTGISLRQNSVALSKGLAIHKGIESLNRQYMEILRLASITTPDVKLPSIDVEIAVAAGLDEFDKKAKEGELQVETGTTEDYLYKEQRALIEFAVRGYAIVRLPYHISTFRVRSVEQEHLLQLSDRIVLMSRSDGTEQRFDNNANYLYEFKTTFAWDDLIAQEYGIDMQGLSTLINAEAGMGQVIAGINMEFFKNGSRRKDKADNVYKQDTWTIRPWAKRNVTGDDLYAWKYYFDDPMTGKGTSLGSTYKRINIWERMPIQQWVDHLASKKIQPQIATDPLTDVFISPVPYQRDGDDVRSFITSTVTQEERVLEGLERMKNAASEDDKRDLLDEYFPQYRHSCINKYRKVCPFWMLCWGELRGSNVSPVDSGVYKAREPHHDAERVMVMGGEEE